MSARQSSRLLRAVALVLPLTVAPLWELVHGSSLTSIASADFWWHLRVGLGILEQHALPHSGWYSQAAALPWRATSWLYEVLVALGYQLLNVRVLPLLAIGFKFALALLTFVLAGGLRGRFWTAVALSAVAQYVLAGLPPLPLFCSVLAFGIELVLLMKFRRDPASRLTWLLPILVLVWANVDQHFVFGVLTLALFAVACWVGDGAARTGVLSPEAEQRRASVRSLVSICGASLLATFVTPYGWGAYSAFWKNATSPANPYFPDFLSLRFRTPQDYVLLLLAMTAFLALGARRSRDGFQVALLVLCVAAAFHSQHDSWLLALAAVAIIGDAVPEEVASGELRAASTGQQRSFLLEWAISLAVLLGFVAVRLPSREATLAKLGETYPVAAANYIRQSNLPAPLFNSFPWGGFLTWYLPEYPVAIDGRTDLYSADANVAYAKVMNFEAHYSTYPPLGNAATILVEKPSLMGKTLPTARGFKKAYEDTVAVVLLRDKVDP